jgi:predicted HicB family RNase H-like nuclease
MSDELEAIDGASLAERALQVQRVAQARFHQGLDWVTFFREMLGVNGVARTVFPTKALMAFFETTKEYVEIQEMVAQLRVRANIVRPEEPTRVITIRLPVSLHELLTDEANLRRTSVNKLCISKLLQVVDEKFVPNAKPPAHGKSGANASEPAAMQPAKLTPGGARPDPAAGGLVE